MLDVRRLRVLLAAVEHGSLTAAARELSYSPSAVSQQIGLLEAQAGAPLLERHARGVRPTAAGELVARRAREVLELLEEAENELRDLDELRAGRLRIGWFSTAGSVLLPRAVAAYRARFPNVRLTLVEEGPERCVELVSGGDLDVALVHDFELAPLAFDERLRAELVFDDEALIGLPAAHRLASRRRIRLGELAGERWIQGVHQGSTAGVLPRACRLAGFEADIVCQTNEHAALQGLVAAGIGVGLVPRMTLPALLPGLVARELVEPRIRRAVRVVTVPRRRSLPATEAMIAVLRTTGRALAAETRGGGASEAGRPPGATPPAPAGGARPSRPS